MSDHDGRNAHDQPRAFRNDRLRQLAECLADECRKPDQCNRLYLDALTVAVCIDFLRLSAEPASRRTGRLAASQVRRTTDYVMAHLSEPVRLSALADLTGLSQWHFARAFKAATGLSPHRWQLNARIARAQELLLSRSMSSRADRVGSRICGAEPPLPCFQECDRSFARRMAARTSRATRERPLMSSAP